MKALGLMVGELLLEFRAGSGVSHFAIGPDHRSFVSGGGLPRCSIEVVYGPIPRMELGELAFQSQGLWAIYRNKKRLFVLLTASFWGSDPARVLSIDDSFRTGTLYVSSAPSPDGQMTQDLGGGDGGGAVLNPLVYPLDELLAVNLLALEGGLNIHACGVDLEGRGYAFCGTSGKGKSTLARLWKARDAVLLSDDRLILRRDGAGVKIYGTPWHGEASFAYPGVANLEAIYFLVQAATNSVRRLPVTEAAPRLFVHTFPTFYLPSGMEQTLQFVGEVCAVTPCYELRFLPDDSVLDHLAASGVPVPAARIVSKAP